ncbi:MULTISPECIES: hypothetical protein [Streptomyces]|uniref:hypothetical protein n=1 Tax=Streptomyces TaxID=1883 RepID=UPI001CE2F4B1|nr:hypothetical protein [Streptomyces sp. AC04842]
MVLPYDHKSLWVKAKLFINRAMDDDGCRSFDEQALWASLSLELLAKAALARVNPLLIAEPTEDGANLLMASGLMEGDARFTSVKAKTLFTRCQRSFKPFNLAEAAKITNARNEYLHGGGIGFASLPPHAWWPRYWAQAVILISALDMEIGDFVGSDREAVVDAHLSQNAKNIEHRTEALIERAKQRLSQYRSGTLPARIAAEWKPGSVDVDAGLKYRTVETCPACGAEGRLEGDTVSDTDYYYEQVSEEDYDVTVSVTVDADYFSCPTCQLVLNGYELIVQAGLPDSFETEGDPDDFIEPEYGND